MTHATQEPGEWAVYDLNATVPDPNNGGKIKPRIHDPAIGHRYALTIDTPCYMPQAHARVFLKDPAFRVEDESGNHVPSLNAALLTRVPPAKLDDEQVVAHVSELTNEALLTRVSQRPGGTKFTDQTRRETLINFLIEGHAQADGGEEGDGGGDADLYTPPKLPGLEGA